MTQAKDERYVTQVGSDVSDRDGMFIELWEGSTVLAEVFYSDVDGAMTVTTFGHNVPLAVLEQLIAEARVRLPPSA